MRLYSRQPTADSHNLARKKRILYVTHDTSLRGGASLALIHTMLDMRARYDIEPVLLVPKDGELPQKCIDNGMEAIVSRFFAWASGNSFKNTMKGIVKVLLNKFFCRWMNFKIIKKQKPFDLIHSNTSVIQIGNELAVRFQVPHVWHLRENIIPRLGMHYNVPKSYVRSQYSSSKAVVAISQSNYEHHVNEAKLCSPDNTRIIYDGLDIPEPYEKVYAHGGHVNFCIIGGVWELKNPLMAVRACIKLKARTDGFMLHIIGDDNNSYARGLRQLVHSEGLEDCVKFWGFRYDVSDMLKTMDVGLTLSKWEAFGRTTVECMLNYCPVIGVDTEATPEIVLDGETGYICPLDNSDRLAEIMHRFITKPELIHSMGTKGRERAVKEFSLERNTDEIYRLYQEILSR